MKLAAPLALILALALTTPAHAAQRGLLTKQQAQHRAVRFVRPFVDLMDINRTVETHMVRPGLCHRVSRRTVECYFWAYLVATRTLVKGSARVHLQRNGLIGVLLPFDPADYWVPLSEPASPDSVAQPVQVRVQ